MRRQFINRMLRLIRRAGFDVVRLQNSTSLCVALAGLRKKGLQINVVYDIGAFDGSWSVAMSECLDKGTEFVLFEPNASHSQELASTGFKTYLALLSDETTEVEFYSRSGTGDSVFRENSTHYDNLSATVLRTQRLDDIVLEERLPVADLIKIDVQGSELKVIHGADVAMESAKLIYIEMSILRYNAGAPLFAEVLEALLERQFLPFAVMESHISSHILVQVDLLFIHRRALGDLFGDECLEAASRFR